MEEFSDKFFHGNIIDVSERRNFVRSRFVAEPVIDRMREVLDKGRMVVVGTNQKGNFGGFVCSSCKHIPRCPKCEKVYFVTKEGWLRCPKCRGTVKDMTRCPKCSQEMVNCIGLGIDGLYTEIKRLFPADDVLYLCDDGKKDDAKGRLIETAVMKEGGIIVAPTSLFSITQFNFTIGLVVYAGIDKLFFVPDYFVSELIFEEIFRSLGRNREVMVQTRFPFSEAIYYAVSGNEAGFREKELAKRKADGTPPFVRYVKFVMREKSEALAEKRAAELTDKLREVSVFVDLVGPYPGSPEVERGKYVNVLLGQVGNDSVFGSEGMMEVVKFCARKKIDIDLDPYRLS